MIGQCIAMPIARMSGVSWIADQNAAHAIGQKSTIPMNAGAIASSIDDFWCMESMRIRREMTTAIGKMRPLATKAQSAHVLIGTKAPSVAMAGHEMAPASGNDTPPRRRT